MPSGGNTELGENVSVKNGDCAWYFSLSVINSNANTRWEVGGGQNTELGEKFFCQEWRSRTVFTGEGLAV